MDTKQLSDLAKKLQGCLDMVNSMVGKDSPDEEDKADGGDDESSEDDSSPSSMMALKLAKYRK